MIEVRDTPFSPTEALKTYELNTQTGALVSFLGTVRGREGEAQIDGLYLEHYPGVTERSIEKIVSEAKARWSIFDPLVIHRVGRLSPGDPIVLVAVSAAHRRDAFEAADFVMDYLKTEALFWKKEIRGAEETWIEPRADDYKDAARWTTEE